MHFSTANPPGWRCACRARQWLLQCTQQDLCQRVVRLRRDGSRTCTRVFALYSAPARHLLPGGTTARTPSAKLTPDSMHAKPDEAAARRSGAGSGAAQNDDQWIRSGRKPRGMSNVGRARVCGRCATRARARVGDNAARAGRNSARRTARGIATAERRDFASALREPCPARIARRFEKKTAADRIAVCSMNIPATV